MVESKIWKSITGFRVFGDKHSIFRTHSKLVLSLVIVLLEYDLNHHPKSRMYKQITYQGPQPLVGFVHLEENQGSNTNIIYFAGKSCSWKGSPTRKWYISPEIRVRWEVPRHEISCTILKIRASGQAYQHENHIFYRKFVLDERYLDTKYLYYTENTC